MIELEEARVLLARAVETQGRDFVYNPGGTGSCLYRPLNEEPYLDDPQSKTGCVVGVALSLAGETRHLSSGERVMGLSIKYPGMLSYPAAQYLQKAQYAQDLGKSWGEAHDIAEQYYQQHYRGTVGV